MSDQIESSDVSASVEVANDLDSVKEETRLESTIKSNSSCEKPSFESLENVELDFESDVNVEDGQDISNASSNSLKNGAIEEENKVIEGLQEKDAGETQPDKNTKKDDVAEEEDAKDEGEISENENELEEGELEEPEGSLPVVKEPIQTKQPTDSVQPLPSLPPEKRPCLYFARGTCQFGDICKYLHISNNYAMFPNHVGSGYSSGSNPNYIRDNQRFPFRNGNNYRRRGSFYSSHHYGDNNRNNFGRKRGQYSQRFYECNEDFKGTSWGRNYDNFEVDHRNRDHLPMPPRDKSRTRYSEEKEYLPNGRKRIRSETPEKRERSVSPARSFSGMSSYSEFTSDSEHSSISSPSPHSRRSSLSYSRSPSPSERRLPNESFLPSPKYENPHLVVKSEKRSNSSCSSRSNKSYKQASLYTDESLKPQSYSGVKRPMTPSDDDEDVPNSVPDRNTKKSRREFLLEQLKEVESAIARKRKVKVAMK